MLALLKSSGLNLQNNKVYFAFLQTAVAVMRLVSLVIEVVWLSMVLLAPVKNLENRFSIKIIDLWFYNTSHFFVPVCIECGVMGHFELALRVIMTSALELEIKNQHINFIEKSQTFSFKTSLKLQSFFPCFSKSRSLALKFWFEI